MTMGSFYDKLSGTEGRKGPLVVGMNSYHVAASYYKAEQVHLADKREENLNPLLRKIRGARRKREERGWCGAYLPY